MKLLPLIVVYKLIAIVSWISDVSDFNELLITPILIALSH